VAETAQTELQAVRPEDLRIGMYVRLKCSWFKHPFPTSDFKLSSTDQIAIIQGIGLDTVLVDPALSDAPKPAAPAEKAAPEDPESAPDIRHPDPSPMAQYQDSLQQADRTYRKVLDQSAGILQSVTAGSEEGLAMATDMVQALTDLILNDATSQAMISLLSREDFKEANVLHALNVCTLSMMVGRSFELPDDQLKALGLAGLFHDLGEQRVPPAILKKRGKLLWSEREALQRHIDYSLEMVGHLRDFPDAAREIIRLHHERMDGSGYPLGLRGRQIPLPAQILMVADEYDLLINQPDQAASVAPSEALSHLYVKGQSLFQPDVIVALVQTLSVYPPGTIVQLSDESYGMVVSINFSVRLKPIVALYDPSAPPDRPRTVNLMEAADLRIVRSFRKQEIPAEIAAALDLKRLTGYFIRSSVETLKEQGVPV
jgi:HD-GYP domain-containing protein (c-di-GMP phosphodiesterase class II)